MAKPIKPAIGVYVNSFIKLFSKICNKKERELPLSIS